MISFQPTDDELAFLQLAKDFAIEKIRPNAREAEKKKQIGNEIVQKYNELGFNTLELPEMWGGLEMSLISQVQIAETLTAYGDLGILQGLPGVGLASSFIRLEPEHPVLDTIKAKCQKGSCPTVAFFNDSHSRNLIIEDTGEGYIIRGTTLPIRMADSAEYLLLAGIDSNNLPVILWLENTSEQQWETNKGDYRLGLLAAGLSRIQFEDFKVNKDQIIQVGEQALKVLEKAIGRMRVIEAAKEVGTMVAALSYATEYSAIRKAFGQEIAKFQGVSFTMAQMAIQTQAVRNLVWYAAKAMDDHKEDAILLSLSSLQSAHRSLLFVTDSAVQLLGGHGYVQEHPVEKWMRDAQAQVNLVESTSQLLASCGDYILLDQEGRNHHDFVRTVTTS